MNNNYRISFDFDLEGLMPKECIFYPYMFNPNSILVCACVHTNITMCSPIVCRCHTLFNYDQLKVSLL